MMRKSSQHKGFSTPEIILVILCLCLVCLGGWYVYHNEHAKTNKPTSDTTKSSTSSSTAGAGDTLADVVAYGKQANPGTLQITNGSVKVNSVTYADYFASVSFDNDTAIADISIKNTSSQAQTYNLDNFSLQLPSEEIVASSGSYNTSNPGSSDNLSVGAGGTVEEDIAFTPIQGSEKAGTGYLEFTPESSNSGSSTNGSATGSSSTGSQTQATTPTTNASTVKVTVTFETPNPNFQQ
jgi:hypothetical protein